MAGLSITNGTPSARDSPGKRKRAEADTLTRSQRVYDSQDDSGDDILQAYETVATVPLARPPGTQLDATQLLSSSPGRITQPTQIIDRAAPSSGSSGPQRPSVVQVAASSPLRADPHSPAASRPRPRGGILAQAMAPAGTYYRPAMPVKRPSAILISSDDEGPTYKGQSSDIEAAAVSKGDIKPSTFARSARDGGPSKTAPSSFGSLLKKFTAPETNGVTSNSVPQKRNADSQGSGSSRAPKQLNSGSGANATSPPSTAAVRKPSADHKDARVVPGKAVKKIRSDFEGRERLASLSKKRGADLGDLEVMSSKAAKQLKQTRPERANAVQDITLESIDNPAICQKIIRMRAVIPSLTVLSCKQALEAKKGNYEDAMDLLSSKNGRRKVVDMITISDDEDDGGRAAGKSHVAAVPTTRREVKAPNRTIQDKWSSTQALPKLPKSPTQSVPATPTKPKKRLVRGTGMQPPPALESAKPSPVRPKSPEPWDDSDSAADVSSEDDTFLHTKVLHFFNSCSIKDLADISNQPEDIAAVIVAHRPFANLEQVRRVSNETSSTTKAGKRRTTKKAIGDKIVDICLDMWTGYEAVDDLVTRCEALGAPVAEEMKKWGVNVYGAAKDGELEIVALDNLSNDDRPTSDIAAQQSVQDSGIGTPSTRAATPAEDEVRSRTIRREAARRKAKLNGLIGQPAIMNPEITLKDYQLVGLNWLSLLYNKGLSCILADDMGLGKTCQVIAFLSHLLERGVRGPHLVVVPGSTLENWLREFRAFSPSLVVEPYYGLEAERAEIRENIEESKAKINVVVTTYDIATKTVDNKFLRRLKPIVCAYDEGHALKNSTSKRYEALMKIPAQFRLLLTGTPLQNNLKELAALLGFIMPSVFKERRGDLEYIFKAKARTTDEAHSALLSAQRIARAKSMMTPFVLRRKKHQVLKDLPAKICRIEYCDMTPTQRETYDAQLIRAREAMAARAAGKRGAVAEAGNVLMQLRKAAIHPLLFRRLFDDARIAKMARACLREETLRDRDADAVLEDMRWMTDFELHRFCTEHPATMARYDVVAAAAANKDSGGGSDDTGGGGEALLDSGKVARLLELLLRFRARGDRALVFSQFTMVLDVLEEVLARAALSFYRFDGSTRIDQRQDMIDAFHKEEDVTVFLLSTKAGGMGVNLACANKVVIVDQSFNPQEDVQAENRAHRVGQTREVEVIRLVSRGTIEESILSLGEAKLVLDDRVAGEEGGGATAAKERDEEVLRVVQQAVM